MMLVHDSLIRFVLRYEITVLCHLLFGTVHHCVVHRRVHDGIVAVSALLMMVHVVMVLVLVRIGYDAHRLKVTWLLINHVMVLMLMLLLLLEW